MPSIFEKEKITEDLKRLLTKYCESGKCKKLRKTGTRHLHHKIETNPFFTEIIVLAVFFIGLSVITPFMGFNENKIAFLNSSWLGIAIGLSSIRYAYYLYKQQRKSGEWSRFIQHATTYFYEQDWENARLYYDKSLEMFPTTIAALNNAGASLTSLEKYVEAIPYYERILEIEPNNVPALNNKAYSLGQIFQLKQSLECYEKALLIDPNSLDSLNNLGAFYLDYLCMYDKSIEYFDKISKIDPNDPVCYTNIAKAFSGKKDLVSTLEYCNIALEKDPKNIEALNQKSVVLFQLKEYESVISVGKLLLQLKPLDSKQNPKKLFQTTIMFNMAMSYANQKKFHEALETIDQFLMISSNDSRALRHKGDFLLELKNYKKALESYNDSLRIEPKQIEVLNNKGLILWEQDKPIQALLTFDEAIKIRSSAAAPWYNKAVHLSKNSENKESVKICYEKVIEIHAPTFEDSTYKGKALIELGRYDEAVNLFDKLLIVEPRNVNVLLEKEKALTKSEKFKDVVEVCDKLLDIIPENTEIQIRKGIALHRNKKFNEALDTFNKILYYDRKNSDALRNKGILLVEKGDVERAITICYNPVLSEEPANYASLYAKGNALGKLQKFNEALMYYDTALEINSDDVSLWLDKSSYLFELGRFDDVTNFLIIGIEKFPHEPKLMYNLSLGFAKLDDYPNAWIWWYAYLQELNRSHEEIDNIIATIKRKGIKNLKIQKIGNGLVVHYDKQSSIE